MISILRRLLACSQLAFIPNIPLWRFVHITGMADNIFECLDDHVLLGILSCIQEELDRKSWSLVCRRFLYAEAASRTSARLLRTEFLDCVLRRFHNLEVLDLSLCNTFGDADVVTLLCTAGPRLAALTFSKHSALTDAGLALLGERPLETIDLSGCRFIGDAGVAGVSRPGTLEVLNLGKCLSVTNSGLSFVTRACGNLTVLVLKGCRQLDDNALGLVASNCSCLRGLDISFTLVTDGGLEHVALMCTLRELNIKACRNVGDGGLAHLARTRARLQELDLSRIPCTVGRVQSFKSSSLRILKLEGCQLSRDTLPLIGRECHFLTELSLAKCSNVTDAGLTKVIASCTMLRQLDVTCCAGITSAMPMRLAELCSALSSLSAESCVIFNRDNLRQLTARCEFLEELDLTACDIDDAGLRCVSACPNLKVLRVGVCNMITDKGLKRFAKGCHLYELDMYRCPGVGDLGVLAITNACKQLKVLNLSYCTEVSDASALTVFGLKQLRQLELRATSITLAGLWLHSERLLELDVKHCLGVGDAAMLAIVQTCPNLKQLNLSYSGVGDAGLLALSRLNHLQNLRLLFVRNASPAFLSLMLSQCLSLKKMKLQKQLKPAIPSDVVRSLEGRGCVFRWLAKPSRMIL